MFEFHRYGKSILVVSAIMLTLSGCGGSSSKNKTPPPPPPPANVAPTANAGADQTVAELAAVTLNGSGSTDSDGTVNTYAWSQTGGTAVVLDEAVPAMPTFTAPDLAANEDLTFSLVVTDDDGAASAADTVVITVTANVAPTANAGPDQTVSSLEAVTLDGSGSADADGTVDVYTWTQTTGTPVVLDETVPAMPTFEAPNVGGDEVLTFELVVTDDAGDSSLADTVIITINPTLALPFTDDFADGNSNGWTSIDDNIENPSAWSAGTGRLVQTVATNDFGKDVTETYRRGTYQWFEDSVNLTNYRFAVDVTPRPASSDDVGVMFRYTNNDNYYRFSLNSESGSARLEKKLNGTFITLANNYRGYLPNRLQQIVVEVDGPLIQVFVNDDPLFAAHDTSHEQGGIGLYTRDGALFDNVAVTVNGTSPQIVIASPEAHDVLPKGPRNVTVTAVARNVPAAGSVDVQMGAACDAAVEGPAGLFTSLCSSVPVGNYLVHAILRDNGIEVIRDTNTDVAIGAEGVGDRYDAIGDSLTLGIRDKFARDNLNLTDQTTISFQGWAGPLGDMLSSANSAPNLVANEGIPGDRVSTMRFQRLSSILERNDSPRSNRALLLAGTNDSNDSNPTDSGLGCVGAACNDTYKGHMQWIIQDLQARGRDTIYIGILPPVWGSLGTPYPDPLDFPAASRNERIVEFNQVIINELSTINGVELGPDFFSCFLTPTVNRFSLFDDSLHPNALGYAFMAALWADALTGAAVVPPVDPCPAPIYILESLDSYAHGHKQNLLEAGDEYYRDESFTLTNVPDELADGIWVSQANADNANATADFLSFDVGAAPVTVYIAYDPAGAPPTSSTHAFAALGAPLSSALTVSDASVGTFSLVEATNVTGTVTIGGNMSGGGAASQGYVVIVVP
jgi:lysophospholipase L1-like esterase